jgi:endonuclease-8
VPEGDTLRRLATRIAERFGGERIVSSTFRHPSLALLDLSGRSLESVDATGKHLFCRFDDGRSLHLHLLMQGRVRFNRQPSVPEWRRRFEIEFESGWLVGVDVPLIHLVATNQEGQVVGHLGPDLCGSYDNAVAVARLESVPGMHLGAALLDQRVVAGFGNIYAVETPFICGVNPFTVVGEVDGLPQLLSIGAALIRTNARLGPQNTTGRRLQRTQHWVLSSGIRNCQVCGERVQRRSGEETPWRRRTVWCPACQHGEHRSVDLVRARKLLALHPARRMLDLDTGLLTADTSEPVVARVSGSRPH